ncbi:MAG: NAD(P)-dependent oxidoreductase [Candidatus Omnitrophota bacterium]
MKILVTGATGFIGGRLVKHLLTKRHKIVCLVRKTSKVDSLKEAGVSLAVGDITDDAEVDRVFQATRPEAVFHCAAKVRSHNEKELHKANAQSTRNICRACRKYDVGRLVYLSSIAVVSANPQVPLTDDLPYKATEAYGRSKIEAERIVMDFRRGGLRVAVIRPCMVYGEDEPHALDRILKAVESRRVPILNVPGMDSRLNLVYVGNVVQALDLALEKDGAIEGTFMIADKEVITLRKFLEILYKGMGAGYPPVVPSALARFFMAVPPLRGKARSLLKDRVYDISRARTILGYAPPVSTEEGLNQTIRYWKDRRKRCQK